MKKLSLVCFIGITMAILCIVSEASAIPAFSRRYKVGCNLCHTVFPRLNEFGRDFKNNGFRTPDEIESADKDTTDFWDKGLDLLPVSMHGKINEEIAPKGQKVSNATTLDELQLNAGINFSSKVSLYIHTHLWEGGEVGKPLIVAVRINDLFNTPLVSLRAGQYELPLSFSPEVERLMAFPYLIFSQAIGANSFTVDQPQLGLELTGNLGNDYWYWLGVVNGSGFEVSPFTGSFDNNNAKDPYIRLAKNFGENSVGVFGYFGQNGILQDSPDSLGLTTTDKFLRIGCDANWTLSNVNLRTAILYGRDANYNGLNAKTSFYGGFVELADYAGDRWVLLGRLEVVELQNVEAVGASDEEGAPSSPDKTTWALTPGFQYLVLPNVKIGLEYQIRRQFEQHRAIAVLHFVI